MFINVISISIQKAIEAFIFVCKIILTIGTQCLIYFRLFFGLIFFPNRMLKELLLTETKENIYLPEELNADSEQDAKYGLSYGAPDFALFCLTIGSLIAGLHGGGLSAIKWFEFFCNKNILLSIFTIIVLLLSYIIYGLFFERRIEYHKIDDFVKSPKDSGLPLYIVFTIN